MVFDEAEALFGTRGEGGGGAGRHDTANVGVLLQRIATFPGVVVANTNLRDAIDPAFDRYAPLSLFRLSYSTFRDPLHPTHEPPPPPQTVLPYH